MGSDVRDDFKVGLFVTLGILALIGTIIFLGGDRTFLRGSSEYRLHMDEVQGLARGSIVSLAGLNVGNVKALRFSSDANKIEVAIDVDQEFTSRITAESTASVKTQGALGDRYVYIEPGPPGAKPLPPGVVITTGGSGDLLDIISERGAELTTFIDVVNELNVLLKNINKEDRSALLMENMVKATDNLDRLLTQAEALLADFRGGGKEKNQLRETLRNLSSILKKIDGGEGTLGALINNPALHEKLMGLLGEPPRNRFIKPLIRESIRENGRVK